MDFDCENILVCLNDTNIEIQEKIPLKFEKLQLIHSQKGIRYYL